MLMQLPKMMKRVTAALGLALLLLMPLALGGSELGETLAITAGTCFYHFAMRLAVGALVPRVLRPNAAERPYFRQRSFEPGLYKTLKVKAWKNRMPTYNPEEFDPGKHSWEEILQSGCVAEAGHGVMVLLSFLPVLMVPVFGAAGVFWGTSVAAAAVDGSFVILQRFNRPRIQKNLQKERQRL